MAALCDVKAPTNAAAEWRGRNVYSGTLKVIIDSGAI
jgi:hypothetical protein